MIMTMIKFMVILFVLMRIKSVVSSSNRTFLSGYRIGDDNNMKNRITVNNLLRAFSPVITNTGFYNSTSFSKSSNSNLYGLYLCRGDIDRELCRACVKDAQKFILVKRFYGQEAAVWYDHCMLRYSNKPFFAKLLNLDDVSFRWYHLNITGNQTRFKHILRNTLNVLVVKAANGRKGKKFATEVVKFTEDETLYALVQCTPDLTSNDCRKCLVNLIGRVQGHTGASKGMMVKHLSCTVRYEIFPFFYSDKIKSFPSPTKTPEDPEIQLRVWLEPYSNSSVMNSTSSSPPSSIADNPPMKIIFRAQITTSLVDTSKIKATVALTNSTMFKQNASEVGATSE